MAEILAALMPISLVVFMAGSLLGMGLALKRDDARAGLSDLGFGARFPGLGFVLGPVLALVLARFLRLDPAYAAGLMLLGLTPCAPFLATIANPAGGAKPRIAASLLISVVGAILVLPFAVPIAIPGMIVDAARIARPMVLFVLLPLAVGMGVLQVFPMMAVRCLPVVKAATGVATVSCWGCASRYMAGVLPMRWEPARLQPRPERQRQRRGQTGLRRMRAHAACPVRAAVLHPAAPRWRRNR